MNLTMIVAIVSVLSALSGVFLGWTGRAREARRAARAEASEDSELRSDVEYIKRGVDDIRVEQRAMRQDMGRLAERVTRVEESAKQAHRRLDEHIRRE